MIAAARQAASSRRESAVALHEALELGRRRARAGAPVADIVVVGREQRADIPPRAFRLGVADDDEFLPIQAL
jgi:hypothetical protein